MGTAATLTDAAKTLYGIKTVILTTADIAEAKLAAAAGLNAATLK